MTDLKEPANGGEALALAVRLGEHLHAFPIEWIEEVLPALQIESVPYCPAFVRGIIFVRGHLIPVISASERLGLSCNARPIDSQIVCLRVGQKLLGLEVDEAVDLIPYEPDRLFGACNIGASDGFFSGIVEFDGQLVRMLDPEKLLSGDEVVELNALPNVRNRDGAEFIAMPTE